MLNRNLSLQLTRVTEIAALESAVYLGRGDKNIADQAAVDGMRRVFDSIDIDGEVVIGEGELDEAPMLYIGEKIGKRTPDSPKVDIAVDPLDGTNCVAKGINNAISVVAIAEKGCLLHAPDMYMHKIAVGPKATGQIDIQDSLTNNLRRVAKALKKDLADLTVTMLDRPRHQAFITEIRELGCRIKLFQDGDVAAAVATCLPQSGVDMLIGIGGAPEGVIAAAALKCLGGDFQGQLRPANPQETKRCQKMGLCDPEQILTLEDLVKGDEVFFAATGISDGDFLRGVLFQENNIAVTHSVVMRAKTGTVRFIEAYHDINKKHDYFKHLT